MNDEAKKKILGKIIQNERKKQGITQDKLASLIDLDPTNLSRIERGKSFPSFETFCNIIEALKVEPNIFLSYISYSKNKVNLVDVELFQNLALLSDNTKIKINELIKTLK